ncbi:hypothetical protein EJB05_20954 [Eragrostis curvula]|uniref:TF-B3 domain-containing protein n=1 Tax=Eragrostis curvula TaxID=38414 RepID=A0A5J9V228_9POAL|nr:hypothetical protein EJB05_20954 [Eragrostis curvula]
MKTQHDSKQKKRNVPSDFKDGKMMVPIDSNNKKRKREEPHTLFKKEKRMQSNDNEKKIHGGNRKEKKNYCGGEKKKRDTTLSFFKVICNNFKESLIIPPSVVPELEGMTNHNVYLQDSEGKVSTVRLSVVDGSLAFNQGWNNFASDHFIKWGEFMLFECSAGSTSDFFSVRIFGRDSRERLHSDVGRKRDVARKKKMHTNTHGDLMPLEVKLEDTEGDCYFSGEYTRRKDPETHHVTVLTKEDPKSVECMVGSGPVPLDNRNGNEVIQQCRTQGMSPIRSKREILVVESESLIHENNIVNLTRSTADSDTQHMPAHTNEDPKRLHSGTGNGQSTVIDEEKGILPGVECGTKSTSPKCSIKRVASVDATPLTHENDDMSKHDLKLHDSGEDLRWKQEIISIHFESTTAVKKYNNSNNGEMNISRDISRKYEAPGGFRCLEKWKNRTVCDRSVLDDTELFKPESTQKTDSQPVVAVEYDAVGLNSGDKCFLSKDTHACSQPVHAMPFKDPSRPDRVTEYEQDGTEINHSIDGKGTVVQLQTKKEQLDTVGSIVNAPGNNNLVCANLIVACNSGPIELNPARSESTFALVESQPTMPIKCPSSPDRISNFGSSRTEVNDNVNGEGIPKLEAKMGHLEPRDTFGSQSTDIPVCANNVAARQSDHCVFKQEDRNSIDFLTHVKTEILTPVKPEILEPDERSLLKISLQFCIPNSTQKWLEIIVRSC